MDSLQFAILVIIHQVSQAGGAVTITFDDNGYIGQSIVLQCKTSATYIVSQNAIWYFSGNVISSTTTGRYSETKTPDGFNLTISDLTTANAGYYRCGIDFGSSSNKTLGILYDTSIEITTNPSTLKVTITIIAYPAPEYNVILTKNGSLVTVLWTSTNITRPDGALNITLKNYPALNKTDYELTVNVRSPVAAFQRYYVNFAPDSEPPIKECTVTVHTTLGSQVILFCPLSSVINNTQWIGPPGNTVYNIEGTTILNVEELPADFVSRLAIHPTTGALIINNIQQSDENCYSCKVLGEVITVKLSIMVCNNVTVYTTLGLQSVLPCPLSSVINNTQWIGPPRNNPYNLPGTTVINFGGLPADFVSRFAIHPATGALIINNTRKSDENCYTCKVLAQSITVKLSVMVSPQPPFIDNNLEDNGFGRMVLWAMEDSQVRLICQIKGGNPQPSLKWIRGGIPWSEVAVNTYLHNNTDGSYNMMSTTNVTANRSEDRVKYFCQANHTTWTSPQNASVELYLYLKPRNPVLSEQGSLQEGGNLSVRCSVTGCRPAANLTWTGLQGQQIQTSTWIPDDETYNVTSLYTTVVSRHDNGVKLVCTVTHKTLGSSLIASTTLAVWFPPTNVSIKNNRNVTAGQDTLTLICTTGTSNPIADITWSNGTNVPSGELSIKTEISGAYGGKILSQNLTIIPTRYMDGSTITCSAQNSMTSARSVNDSVILSVMYSPDVFVVYYGSLRINSTVLLTCIASGKPSQYTFHEWVHKIGETEIRRLTGENTANTSTLTLPNISIEDMGTYMCTVDISITGQNGQIKQTEHTDIFVHGNCVNIQSVILQIYQYVKVCFCIKKQNMSTPGASTLIVCCRVSIGL